LALTRPSSPFRNLRHDSEKQHVEKYEENIGDFLRNIRSLSLTKFPTCGFIGAGGHARALDSRNATMLRCGI
jgi:hypothetical protein